MSDTTSSCIDMRHDTFMCVKRLIHTHNVTPPRCCNQQLQQTHPTCTYATTSTNPYIQRDSTSVLHSAIAAIATKTLYMDVCDDLDSSEECKALDAALKDTIHRHSSWCMPMSHTTNSYIDMWHDAFMCVTRLLRFAMWNRRWTCATFRRRTPPARSEFFLKNSLLRRNVVFWFVRDSFKWSSR